MTGRALVGELPFRWQTDFHFPWAGGWLKNQNDETYERDLVVVIPGRNRRRAVVMADHYDTAYMEDRLRLYQRGRRTAAGGRRRRRQSLGHRRLDAGRAPSSWTLPRQGKLACDIWLVHLTGEEFPTDCMGARHLCQCLVEGSLQIRLANGRWRDLSRTRVAGVYVLDMVAHNNDRDRDVFQNLPGHGAAVDVAGRAGPRGQPHLERLGRGVEPPGRAGAAAAAGSGAPTGGRYRPSPCIPQLHGEVRPPLQSPQHALQHRRPDLLRRRRARRSLHGELRHQPARLSRQPGHDGEHRPGLRRGGGGDRHRVGGPGRDGRAAVRFASLAVRLSPHYLIMCASGNAF